MLNLYLFSSGLKLYPEGTSNRQSSDNEIQHLDNPHAMRITYLLRLLDLETVVRLDQTCTAAKFYIDHTSFKNDTPTGRGVREDTKSIDDKHYRLSRMLCKIENDVDWWHYSLNAISVSIIVFWVPVIEKSLVEENWGGVHEPYQVCTNRESKAFKSNSDIRLKRSAANLEDLPTCKMSKLPRHCREEYQCFWQNISSVRTLIRLNQRTNPETEVVSSIMQLSREVPGFYTGSR
ncbi:hypothetical protein BDR07DRAFT_1549692 [Suillus spraguei]|nr:hypothetical protein BDR07DRAFT_1549692 [Suillus spraguei]